MSEDPRALYALYDTVLAAIQAFAQSEGVRPTLPAPVAPALEFPIVRTLVAPVHGASQLVLPASNTYQKQIAAAHQGSVYCIAPCYRQDEDARLGVDHLNAFHQIEFEVPNASMEDARAMAGRLLTTIWQHARDAGFDPPPWSFDLDDAIDLATIDDPPMTLLAYDAWALSLAEELHGPRWILHTPRTPAPRLNLDFDYPGAAELTLGFDLVTPVGELLSGGQRDTDETRDFYLRGPPEMRGFYKPPPWLDGLQLGSSGFGIGLERMLRGITGALEVRDVVLPHCIDGRL